MTFKTFSPRKFFLWLKITSPADGGDFVMNNIDVLMFQMFVACYYRQCKLCEIKTTEDRITSETFGDLRNRFPIQGFRLNILRIHARAHN